MSGLSYAYNVHVCNKSMCNVIRQVTTRLPRSRCCIHCNRIHITSYVTNQNTAVCCIFAYKNCSLVHTYISRFRIFIRFLVSRKSDNEFHKKLCDGKKIPFCKCGPNMGGLRKKAIVTFGSMG